MAAEVMVGWVEEAAAAEDWVDSAEVGLAAVVVVAATVGLVAEGVVAGLEEAGLHGDVGGGVVSQRCVPPAVC